MNDLPRLLRADLARALGAPLWTAPLPASVQPTRLLRLELLAFDLQAGLRGLQVQARYSLTGTGLAPRAGEIAFVPAGRCRLYLVADLETYLTSRRTIAEKGGDR